MTWCQIAFFQSQSTLLQNLGWVPSFYYKQRYMRLQCTLRLSINFVHIGRTENRAKPSLFKSYHFLSFLSQNTLTQKLARWPPNQAPRKRICWIFIGSWAEPVTLSNQALHHYPLISAITFKMEEYLWQELCHFNKTWILSSSQTELLS